MFISCIIFFIIEHLDLNLSWNLLKFSWNSLRTEECFLYVWYFQNVFYFQFLWSKILLIIDSTVFREEEIECKSIEEYHVSSNTAIYLRESLCYPLRHLESSSDNTALNGDQQWAAGATQTGDVTSTLRRPPIRQLSQSPLLLPGCLSSYLRLISFRTRIGCI